MKKVLLLGILACGAYFAYQKWFAPEPPPPAPPVVEKVAAPKPAPVDFAVRARVNKLFGEWKRRSLGNRDIQSGVSTIDPQGEIKEIRKLLFRDGIHSADAVEDVVIRALRELGVAEKDLKEVARGILGMR